MIVNKSGLCELEAKIGKPLPHFYLQTLLEYPFPRDSFANVCLLPAEEDAIVRMNLECQNLPCPPTAIFIGSDGGEEVYFLDLAAPEGTVFKYDFEARSYGIKAQSWDEYLQGVVSALEEIAKDETEMATQRANKKWWQIWR